MASIRRTDIMHKYSKGRLAKSVRERIYKRQEVYKLRDSRRVHLAGSFDRWRKLRSSLKLKDSSLAWHLMEAHEKGHCNFCRHCNFQSTKEREQQRKACDQKEFLPSLISSIRHLCHAHFDFTECIEIVGLLCLEFDKARKENFSLNECIRPGIKSDNAFVSQCRQELPVHSQQEHSLSMSHAILPDVHQIHASEHNTKVALISKPCSSVPTNTEPSTDAGLLERLQHHLATSGQDNFESTCTASQSPIKSLNSLPNNLDPLTLPFPNDINICSDVTTIKSEYPVETSLSLDAADSDDTSGNYQRKLDMEQKLMDSSLCSESEPSLEIDIERMDTSHEDDSTAQSFQGNKSNLVSSMQQSGACQDSSLALATDLENQHALEKGISQCNKIISLPPTNLKDESVNEAGVAKLVVDKPENIDLPLDMSVLKSTIKKEIDTSTSHSAHDHSRDASPQNYRGTEEAHLELAQFSSSTGKRKISETNCISTQNSRQSPFWLEGIQSFPARMKEEGHASIPWQRRDMSRKEEYEFLEMNPFSDLADFSQHYPHVHQRTYYRWKRRIKEEYIILEQCPGMSFQEFSSVVLQAKESVFCHWKSLISQGKGFFAPSDASKRLETKCLLKPSSHHNSAYVFMQKNVTFTHEQFCQQYPGTPVDVFNVLKRKAMQEFWLFHQNQHMSHNDFSKLVNVSEDVFNTWKKCVESFRSNVSSSDIKPVSSGNSHTLLPSFNSLDSSHSSNADLQYQSTKDGRYNIKDSSTVFKDTKSTAHPGALNSPLSDSAARSLSNSYLASLQNMMFPWHSYYGMTSSIGQQMLPMMLWPGMMGLAGGMTNPLGLMSNVHTDATSKSNAVVGIHYSLLGTSSESTESLKSDESQSNHSDEHVHASKRLGSESQEQSRSQASSDGEKRLKMSSDKDDVDFMGSVSRSRKQNKQEYIYYLKNPELCFKELESLFPSISLRTFYRWRKEMNAAVLLLEDNKSMTFHQFQMVFPDIPEDIFESWKDRVCSGLSPTLEKQRQQSVESEELNCSDQIAYFNDRKFREKTKSSENTDQKDSHFTRSPVTVGIHSNVEDVVHVRRNVKEGYIHMQKNPNIDFASFSKLYPDVSVRSFYRWKKELKDAMDFLNTNPTMVYEAYKTVNSTVSEDVFNVWKSLTLDNHVFKEEISEDNTSAEEKETRVPNFINRKQTGPEYWFLQLNPDIEFSQFTCTYPNIPKRTFYSWKQEIQKIVNYIQTEPSVEFADIAAVLPQVSEAAFTKWKNAVVTEVENHIDSKSTLEKQDTNIETYRSNMDEYTKGQMTEALLYLMHNPTIKYSQFRVNFDFVSSSTFELWLKRIQTVILYIASNPSIEYAAFSNSIKDVAQDIFEKWKSLTSDDIATLGVGCEEAVVKVNLNAESRIISDGSDAVFNKDNINHKAYEFCQKNSNVSFTAFHTLYPTVSEKLFCGWISQIQEELQYIKDNVDLQFDDFAKVYPDTTQDIFDLWKCNNSKIQTEDLFQEPLGENKQDDSKESTAGGESKLHIISDKLKSSEVMDSVKGQEEGNETLQKSHSEDFVRDDEVATPNINEITDDRHNESSLSKLAQFADSNTSVCNKKHFTRNLSSSSENVLKNNNNKSIKLEPVFSPDVDNYVSDPSISAHHLHSRMSYASDMDTGEMYNSSPLTAPLHTSSLSALMAMSRNDDTHNRGSQVSSPQKDRTIYNIQPLCSGTPNWQRTTNGLGTYDCGGATKDDDEAFSSQRQKKMSRAEYLFVKDNPDVDSQEFSRIFPGVSARTFYRWKKEIKAQLHLA